MGQMDILVSSRYLLMTIFRLVLAVAERGR
jgi:hypothetical protein